MPPSARENLIPIVCRCGRVFYTVQIKAYEVHYPRASRSRERKNPSAPTSRRVDWVGRYRATVQMVPDVGTYV